MPDEKNVHASCIAINGKGVLLLGDSGSGKSDLALRLIDDGARLVADDRTILFLVRNALHARAPDSIWGLIEVRGVGIVKQPALKQVKLALAVRLGGEGPRLPRPAFFQALNTKVPQIALDSRFASSPAKVRTALAAFGKGLFRDTFNPK